jgi:hypothetical protein
MAEAVAEIDELIIDRDGWKGLYRAASADRDEMRDKYQAAAGVLEWRRSLIGTVEGQRDKALAEVENWKVQCRQAEYDRDERRIMYTAVADERDELRSLLRTNPARFVLADIAKVEQERDQLRAQLWDANAEAEKWRNIANRRGQGIAILTGAIAKVTQDAAE